MGAARESGQQLASIKQRPDGRWRARYRDDQEREHFKHFDPGLTMINRVARAYFC
jgi:hypothetical protein